MTDERNLSLRKMVEETFQDFEGYYSSKRTTTAIACLLISVAFIANLFWDFTIDEFIFDGMMYIVIAGMGGALAERFVRGKYTADNEKHNE